ncbi:MAG: hypothetical protein IJD04_03920, partial [Desulfovibrionaceae bacterium]|nr:hypothetical protein [Desulfovibrionaceae bacterium]
AAFQNADGCRQEADAQAEAALEVSVGDDPEAVDSAAADPEAAELPADFKSLHRGIWLAIAGQQWSA